MKILVTVGTTTFDSLIKYIDRELSSKDFDIELQIAKGKYIPQNHPYFNFLANDDIDLRYQNADIIITHAGCGSIYKLLELKKRIIVVPNLERSDKHQLDLARYVERNNFALVAYKIGQLKHLLTIAQKYNFVEFHKDGFFKADEIMRFILNF
jgi:beta-1,4-N-acetylglucosaminyltransferase